MAGFWMYETTGVLRPVIEAYLLTDAPLTVEQVAAMRAYLRQWIYDPAWVGPGIHQLRCMVDGIHTRADITRWLDLAMDSGIDPL